VTGLGAVRRLGAVRAAGPVRAAAVLGALAVAGALVGPSCVGAQSHDGWSGEGFLGWSALERAGDLPRAAPLLPPGPPSLLGPRPRVGAFWSGRNPAGLAWEVDEAHAEMGARLGRTEGEYRRPLDPGGVEVASVGGFAWQPVGERIAMAGHAAYTETSYDPGTPATTLSPYGSIPLVVTDTTVPGQRLQSVRLEGAAGRRLGNLGVGATLGFEAVNGHAQVTNVPRRSQASRPGAVVGAAYELAEGAVRIGAFGRWAGEAETITISAVGANTYLVHLRGFAEPHHTAIPAGTPFHRRRDADERAAGLTAAGVAGAWSWAVHGEAGRVTDRQSSDRAHDPRTDRWDADIAAAGGAVQGAVGDGDALLTLSAGWTRSEGVGVLHADEAPFYRATEEIVTGTADLRWLPAGSPWGARGVLLVGYDRRDRGEPSPDVVHTRLEGLSTQLGAEVMHALSERVSLAAGAERTGYQPRGSVPRPQNFHPQLRPLVAPETAFYATPSAALGASFGALVRTGGTADVRVTGRYRSLEPQPAGAVAEMQPTGSRSGWSLEVTAVLR
jgi:hypothetical protein